MVTQTTTTNDGRRIPGTARLGAAGLATWIVAALVGSSVGRPARAQSCVPETSFQRPGVAILLETDDVVAGEWATKAIELWGGCANYATDFPRFLLGSGTPSDRHPRTTRTVQILRSTEPGSDGRCGAFQGNTITLHDTTVSHRGRVVACGSQHLNLAHELGHVLGLADLHSDPRCRTQIMAQITTSRRHGHRFPSSGECRAAGNRWLLPNESELVASAP